MTDTLPQSVVQPLEFAVAAGSRRFAPWAGGPVHALEIEGDGRRLGWAWWSDSERAAGWVSDQNSGQNDSPMVRAWTQHLDAVAAAGSSPSAAFEHPLPGVLGTVSSERPDEIALVDLHQRAGRPRPDFPSAADLAFEALSGQPVSGATLDAGLRSQVPMSDAMRAQVDGMDAALQRKPVPERMVVSRATSLAAWPGEPEALIGQLLVERAYFPVRLGPIEPAGHDAVVHLAVPPGVPAIYTAPPDQPSLGYLILARNLTWTVVDAAQAPSGTWVLSADAIGVEDPP